MCEHEVMRASSELSVAADKKLADEIEAELQCEDPEEGVIEEIVEDIVEEAE